VAVHDRTAQTELWHQGITRASVKPRNDSQSKYCAPRHRFKRMGFSGFSWKRATGLSAAKARLLRRIGIPLTRSGRQRKLGKIVSVGGCLVVLTIMVAIPVGLMALLIALF
jgi:hypothetical protein